MKTLITILSITFCWSSMLLAQRIPPAKPVIVKATSTECNVCGLGAWDEFKDVIDRYEEEAVIMAVHPLEESILFTNTAQAYTENLSDFFGTPTLYINEESHFDAWLKGIRDYIEPFQDRQVVVHPFVKYTIEEEELKVEVKTQFLKATNRPHYLSVYVLENQITAEQQSRGPEDKHSKVLRTHLGENAMGDLFATDPIEVDQVFINNFSLEIDPSWNAENLEIAVIIWEIIAGRHIVVNSNTALSPVSMLTHTNELVAAKVKMKVQPTILNQQSIVQLEIPKAQKNVDLKLMNVLGQEMKTIFSGDLQAGYHTFELNKQDYSSTGIYFLILEKDRDQLVEKIVIR